MARLPGMALPDADQSLRKAVHIQWPSTCPLYAVHLLFTTTSYESRCLSTSDRSCELADACSIPVDTMFSSPGSLLRELFFHDLTQIDSGQ